jgi:intersectin
LSDIDKDGNLSLDEFVIAMHLCDFAKSGQQLPTVLPAELYPGRVNQQSFSSPVTTPTLGNTAFSPQSGSIAVNTSTNSSPTPSLTKQQQLASATFEDKRRENFDRGNAVLEAKRQMLREQEEREKREREEKERLENERRQKLKEEQERRRLEDLERQRERQRIIDEQREQERQKIQAQRDAARFELLRQQKLEWERQKKQELEHQRIRLQEQLSTMKAKDENLENDMKLLDDKINTYTHKINNSQTTLSDLNARLENARRIFLMKQSEVDSAESQLRDFNQRISRLNQEKLHLTDKQRSLGSDNPFAEEYRNVQTMLKQKQQMVNQLKNDVETVENEINVTRTQYESAKHDLETGMMQEKELFKENNRLAELLAIKRGVPQYQLNSSFDQTNSFTNGHQISSMTPSHSQSNGFKQTVVTPKKGNYKSNLNKKKEKKKLLLIKTKQLISIASSCCLNFN